MVHNNKRLFLLSLIFMLACFSGALPADNAEPNDTNSNSETSIESQTPLQKLSNINMQLFPWKNYSWSTTSNKEYLKLMFENCKNPKPRHKRMQVFDLFLNVEKNHPINIDSMLNDTTTWNDLNLFYGGCKPEHFVANVIDQTKTAYGKIVLYTLLAQPVADISLLKKRQNVIQALLNDPQLKQSLASIFTKLAEQENCVLSFWEGKQHCLSRMVHDFVLFNLPFIKKLNKSHNTLLVKNIYDHTNQGYQLIKLSFVTAVLITYGVLVATDSLNIAERACSSLGLSENFLEETKKRNEDYGGLLGSLLSLVQNKWLQSGLSISSGLLCALYLPQQYEHFECGFLLDRILLFFAQHIAETINQLRALYNVIKSNNVFDSFEECQPIKIFFEKAAQESDELAELLQLLQSETMKNKDVSFWDHIFAHKGIILRSYVLIDKLKNLFENVLAAAGRMDAYCGLAQLYQDCENSNTPWCFPTYVTAATPSIAMTNFWHPLVNNDDAVTNSITLGTDGQRQNIIVTGPNEGGKSTTLKAITLGLFLGQTIGMSPAESLTFTPFSVLSTYLNITDDVGAGNSLFKAEVLRVQTLLSKLNTLADENKEAQQPSKIQHSFTVFDEMLQGTSPAEGEAAAYSVAHELGQFPNNICLIATHFGMLTKLEQETGNFANYKVSIIKNNDGSIHYPYKLEKGISHQHIAIDVLRNQGFSNGILDKANSIIQAVGHL